MTGQKMKSISDHRGQGQIRGASHDVERGETIVITRHGKTIARITPEIDARKDEVAEGNRGDAGSCARRCPRPGSRSTTSLTCATKATNIDAVRHRRVGHSCMDPARRGASARRRMRKDADRRSCPRSGDLVVRSPELAHHVRAPRTARPEHDLKGPRHTDSVSDRSRSTQPDGTIVLDLARTYALTAYDAAYLELAVRTKSRDRDAG